MKEQERLADIIRDESVGSARTIRRVVKIGCVVNLMLMAMKLSAGYWGHSDALVADGFHSLNDLAADIIMLFFVGLSYRHADSRYSYGYGKFETFSTFLISAFLLVVGFGIAFEGVESIAEYAGGAELPQPDIWTVVVVVVAMACKEGLYRFYSAAGRKADCQALVANAWHHRSDAMASVATLIGVSAAHFFGPSFRILDPLASLVLAVFILIPALKLFRRAFAELMERSLPEADVELARKTVESVEGVEGIKFLRTRRNGHHLIFDIGALVSPDLTFAQGEEVAQKITAAMERAFCPHIVLTVSLSVGV